MVVVCVHGRSDAIGRQGLWCLCLACVVAYGGGAARARRRGGWGDLPQLVAGCCHVLLLLELCGGDVCAWCSCCHG